MDRQDLDGFAKADDELNLEDLRDVVGGVNVHTSKGDSNADVIDGVITVASAADAGQTMDGFDGAHAATSTEHGNAHTGSSGGRSCQRRCQQP
jgi:hypothetical protein